MISLPPSLSLSPRDGCSVQCSLAICPASHETTRKRGTRVSNVHPSLPPSHHSRVIIEGVALQVDILAANIPFSTELFGISYAVSNGKWIGAQESRLAMQSFSPFIWSCLGSITPLAARARSLGTLPSDTICFEAETARARGCVSHFDATAAAISSGRLKNCLPSPEQRSQLF